MNVNSEIFGVLITYLSLTKGDRMVVSPLQEWYGLCNASPQVQTMLHYLRQCVRKEYRRLRLGGCFLDIPMQAGEVYSISGVVFLDRIFHGTD